MSRWRALVLGLMAMLFAASAVAHAAPPPAEPAPCHAMAQGHAPKDEAPHHDMLAMNCCLGCLPGLAALVAVPAEQPQRVTFDLRQDLLDGLILAPELGPPRAA